jgi:hypothetical protein
LNLRITRSPERTGLFPAQTWELIELVMAGCPEEPLKTFRKTLIGRGKPLTARQADAAIGGARCASATGPADGRRKRAYQYEGLTASLARMRWYLRHRMPVVFARAHGHQWNEAEIEIIKEAAAGAVPVTFLEWNETAVDRTAGPACLPGQASANGQAGEPHEQ